MKFDTQDYIDSIDSSSGKENASRAFILFNKYLDLPVEKFALEIDKDQRRRLAEKEYVWRETIQEYVDKLSGRGYLTGTIKNYASMIRSCLYYMGIKKGSLPLEHVKVPETGSKSVKHEWTKKEVELFISKFKYTRNKAVAAFIFQSGLSISDIISLTYGDVKEELREPPLGLKLKRKKTRVQFYTFAARTTVELLRKYLETRSNLSGDSPLVANLRNERAISTSALSRAFRVNGHRCDFIGERERCTPHSLRGAFNTILLATELKAIEVEFLMGHSLGSTSEAYLRRSFSEWKERYHQVASDYLSLDL